MNSSTHSTWLEADNADTARRAEHTAYYRQVLHGLIDDGADLARLVHRQAHAAADAAPQDAIGPDVAVTFERIARTVRRCILLARRLDEPVTDAGSNRISARRRIIRAVEDAIQRDAPDDEADSLHAEFLERLDAPDIEDDIADRPVAEIIADICHDLGLAPFPALRLWKRRTPADIALLCARAAGRGDAPGWTDERDRVVAEGVRRFGGP